jgi:ComF family protein
MHTFLDLFFPPRCPVCDRLLDTADMRRGSRIHARCRERLYEVTGAQCFHCGRPLADAHTEYCSDCAARKKQNPRYSSVIQGKALYVYRGDVKKTMYRYKYANRREYARFFAEEANRRLGAWIAQCGVEAIVPVPMYRRKETYRGYNQAKLLARQLSKLTGLPYVPDAVRRVKNTRPQKELDALERENNLKNAFQTSNFVVKYKCILLVDDIYTTGATAEAIAQELCLAGVEEIYFFAICIAKGI